MGENNLNTIEMILKENFETKIIYMLRHEKGILLSRSIRQVMQENTKEKNLLVFKDFSSDIKKTKEMDKIVKKFEITNSLIILDKNSKEKIEKSLRNIPNIKVTDINHFSAFDLIKFKKIVFTESSVKELEKRYS